MAPITYFVRQPYALFPRDLDFPSMHTDLESSRGFFIDFEHMTFNSRTMKTTSSRTVTQIHIVRIKMVILLVWKLLLAPAALALQTLHFSFHKPTTQSSHDSKNSHFDHSTKKT